MSREDMKWSHRLAAGQAAHPAEAALRAANVEHSREVGALLAENEQLREALEQIMDGTVDKVAYARAWGALGAEASKEQG